MLKPILSLVIPVYNEFESLPELAQQIRETCDKNHISFETWFIDDGSTDDSWKVITLLHKKDPRFKGVKFRRNYGKSAALAVGFRHVRSSYTITMDADLQDDPNEIPALIHILEEGYDLVSGWKQKRNDPLSKTIPSRFFNWVTQKASGIPLNDFNCGLKAYKNIVVKNIEVSGEMHRYIPVLAKNAGFSKIGEKVVLHQARKYGNSKFGMSRFINGFLDLITIWFLSTFGKRPMHLFGLLGSIMFIIGFLFAFYLGIDKLFIHKTSRLITNRPQFYLSITAMIIGTQLFLAGFLGEIILRTKNNEERYKISEEL